jgi:hypothetical protein
MPAANEFVEQKIGSGGTPIGPRLRGSIFVPLGIGVVYEDGQGGYWMQRLARNADGTALLDENGNPALELQKVNI